MGVWTEQELVLNQRHEELLVVLLSNESLKAHYRYDNAVTMQGIVEMFNSITDIAALYA